MKRDTRGRRHRRAIPNFWRHQGAWQRHKDKTIRHQDQQKPERPTGTVRPSNLPSADYWAQWRIG